MLDMNNKQIVAGQFLKVTGCKTKGDNSIYIVDKQYERGNYCLLKVTQTGEISKSKYNIFFLDEKHDTAKQVAIIEQSQLKQAAKEVKEYVNSLTANETVYTFTKTDEQEIQIGLYVNFLKSALLRGHINSISGMYEIENVTADRKVQLHLMGKKGERIADNMNGYYQFQPITLYFNDKVMQQLFTENYIEILARTASMKGDIIEQNTSIATIATALVEVTEPIETKSIEIPKQQDEETEQPTQTVIIHYFSINERAAETANTLNSHYDYVKGSATQEYKNTVNSIAEKAQRQITKYPEKLQEVQTLLDRYSKQLADWHNKQLSIRCMCPSILVCGAGNFPTRKKEKQNRAEDRHMQEYEKIEQLANKIASASVSNVIKSGDTNALEQLQSKLAGLQDKREAIKAYNAKARKEKTEQAPSYMLSNLSQTIRNTEQRIEQLQKTKEQPTEDKTQQYNTSMCKVVENTEIMRLQLLFDGKPDDDIRSILKSHGFKWSPTNTAWQRQLTDNARYATQQVIKLIEEQNTVNQAS